MPQDFQWYMLAEDHAPEAALLFAPQASDNIAIEFSCKRGSQRAKITSFNEGTGGTRLFMASGTVSQMFKAKPMPQAFDSDGSVVSVVEVETSNAVLAAFRRSGALTRGSPPETLRTATTAELAEIKSFFDFCDGRQTGS